MQNDDEKTFDGDGYKFSYGKFHGTYFYILPEFEIKSKLYLDSYHVDQANFYNPTVGFRSRFEALKSIFTQLRSFLSG